MPRRKRSAAPDPARAWSATLAWAFRHCSFRGSRQCPGEGLRLERLKIAGVFADADEMHRQTEFVRERHEDTALRGAVELGHHETGQRHDRLEGFDLRKRVLPRRGIEHEEHSM